MFHVHECAHGIAIAASSMNTQLHSDTYAVEFLETNNPIVILLNYVMAQDHFCGQRGTCLQWFYGIHSQP